MLYAHRVHVHTVFPWLLSVKAYLIVDHEVTALLCTTRKTINIETSKAHNTHTHIVEIDTIKNFYTTSGN